VQILPTDFLEYGLVRHGEPPVFFFPWFLKSQAQRSIDPQQQKLMARGVEGERVSIRT